MSKLRMLGRERWTAVRGFADCGQAVKKGLVIGAYDGCSVGELKLTPTARAFDERNAGGVSLLLKGGMTLGKGRANVFTNLGEEFHSVALSGLGEEGAGYSEAELMDECKENIRWAAGTGARALQEAGATQIFVEAFECAEAAAEGAALAIWQYQDVRSPQHHKPTPKLELYESSDLDGWKRGIIKAENQNLARRLEETPANLMTPTSFAQWILDALCPCGIQVEVRDRDWMESAKMNAMLAMTRGSCEEPLVLEIGYCGGKPDDKPITLVGKGVTFDSGGLCLKPCAELPEKRGDMAGAAVVCAAIKCAAQMALPLNVKALVPLMESMTGGGSVKCGDVMTALNGRTVCIENPAHEGRVLLMDPLYYSKGYSPCLCGTVGSLTRGAAKGVGSGATPFFTTSEEVAREMEAAGAETGDRVWRFPIWKYYVSKVTHGPADVMNEGEGGGQPCLAAAFLRQFVPPGVDFFHMDIYGTGMLARGNNFPYLRKGLFTGRPTRTLAQFFWQVACPHSKETACM